MTSPGGALALKKSAGMEYLACIPSGKRTFSAPHCPPAQSVCAQAETGTEVEVVTCAVESTASHAEKV